MPVPHHNEDLSTGYNITSYGKGIPDMLVPCAFRHEEIPEQNMVELDAGRAAAKVCNRCLVLITIHRRIHHMKLEQIIPKMAE